MAGALIHRTSQFAGPATSYSTTFTGSNENPLSEGGKWLNGQTDGLDWRDFQLVSNHASPAAFSSSSPPPYNDAIAILKPSVFTPTSNQYVEIVVFRAGGYSPPGTHENGMFLRFSLSAHDAHGYEVYINHSNNCTIVRWNGALNDFTPLSGTGPGPTAPVNGDRLRFEAVGSTLTLKQNDVTVLTATDSTYTSGQPGIQGFVISTSTLASYGTDTFTCGNL